MEPSTAPRPRWRNGARVLLAMVVLVFVAAGLRQAWTDSPTVDEGVDLASGLSSWVHHDLRMSPEHPVLPKLLATAPALAADPIVPRDRAWAEGDWFDHTESVLSANDDAGRLRRIVFLSRLVPLAMAVACGTVLFVLGRRLAGEEAGLLAAGLWFTTPVALGFGHVQSLDVSFTLATLLVALALHRVWAAPSLAGSAWVGVALAGALATRHTAIVLVPVAVGVAASACRSDRRRALVSGGVVALTGYAGLWLAYRGFDLTAPTGAPGARFDGIIAAAGDRSVLARAALAVPAPQEWRAGLGYLTLTSEARPAWLAGQAWTGSRWWFFPVSFLVKVPIPALLVLVLGPLAVRRLAPARRLALALAVALPGLALFAFTVLQPLNLGVRLVLPSLALWMAAASPAAPVLLRSVRGRAALGVVVVFQVGALVAASSHSLAWSPLPFRPAHWWVSDSNLDFGQDRWRVQEWSEGRDARVALIAPRGLGAIEGTRPLRGVDPAEVRGWVAVGATVLTVVDRDELAWVRAYCPVGTLGGGSVLLYRFASPPSDRPGPDRPVAPCIGASSSRRR